MPKSSFLSIRPLAIGAAGAGFLLLVGWLLAPTLSGHAETAVPTPVIAPGAVITPEQAGELGAQEWARFKRATPVTASEVFSEAARKPWMAIPFVSSAMHMAESLDLRDALQAQGIGAATQKQKDEITTAAVQQSRVRTWKSRVASLATGLPAFAGEILGIAFLASWVARRRRDD